MSTESRKRQASDMSQSTSQEAEVNTVAAGYSALVKDRSKRKDSQVFRLFSFNNWVKSTLINEFIPKGATVLDFGCGKGGDLQKFERCEVRFLVGADVAHTSVEEAVSRYNSLRNKMFGAKFLIGDCHSTRICDYLERDIVFDAVSCQFSLHYSFMTEERARMALTNISERLRPGGIFVGTIPDANVLVKRFRESEVPGRFGNAHVEVTLAQASEAKVEATFPDAKAEDPLAFPKSRPFGIQYNFRLTDAIDDLPEYLVPFNVLERLANDVGLELVQKHNFHEFYYEYTSSSKDPERYKERMEVLKRMKVHDDQDMTLTPEEWDIANLYLAFAFRKRADCAVDKAVLDRGVAGIADRSPRHYPPKDIIRLR